MNIDRSPAWISGLNEHQISAVTHGSDPLLILAGAGSGKTRVITSRIAWMIGEKGFNPASILAVTFTNKAAREMRERVSALVPGAESVMIRTFHSFGAWMLRRNASAVDLSPNFTIYDEDDQVSLLAQILSGLPKRELRLWVSRISRAKDRALQPDDDLRGIVYDYDFPEIYKNYEKRLREIGNVDFGDLIQLPVQLLRNHPAIQERIQQRFKAVLVDEYQDTNIAQYRLLKELTSPETWLAVVGDDDQSIYRFRGAEVENILRFPDVFPGTKVVRLEQNYRSTSTILDIASAVVKNNKGRLGKTLWTDGKAGEKAQFVSLDDTEAEAEWCAEQAEKEENYAGLAILYRINAQSRIFETVFRRRGIPYRIVGTLSFYQREEIRDILAYMAWIANPKDEVAFRRIANKPTRGLGKKGLNSIIDLALRSFGGNILDACKNHQAGNRSAKAQIFLFNLASRYPEVSGRGKKNLNFDHLGFLVQDILVQSDMLEHYKEIDRIDSSRRIDNLDELVNAASDFPANAEGMTAFLELVELDQANLEEEEEDSNRVTLITMHNTKGLEFDSVIISGMEEGLFPRGDDIGDEEDLEEERRLFYVAITRARKKLAFTMCRQRMLWGHFRDSDPSRFLNELPSDKVRSIDESDLSVETDYPWQPGVRIYHDDYGEGTISKRLINSGHSVIHVFFDSGHKATIIPEFSSYKMEILKP